MSNVDFTKFKKFKIVGDNADGTEEYIDSVDNPLYGSNVGVYINLFKALLASKSKQPPKV